MSTPVTPPHPRSPRAVAAALLCTALAGAVGAVAAPAWAARREARPSGPAVTSIGFHVLESGESRILIRLTASVPLKTSTNEKKVEIQLEGARVPGSNNRRPLRTEHFATLVQSARLVEEKEAAVLVVELREVVAPQSRVAAQPDGSALVVVDFPKPASPAPTSAP